MNDIQNMKKDFFGEAISCSLNVFDEFNNKIATLVPIGPWALSDEELLSSFMKWRQTFMRFFLTQFSASKKGTRGYLKDLSIRQTDRIFFAIYVDNILFGHIGLSNVNESKAELDNMIRGVSGGHKNLMYFSEKAVLTWAFDTLKVETVDAKVMSRNFIALSLHERLGFKLKERFFLRKVIHESSFSYEICEKYDATEKFFLDIIEVNKFDFIDAISRQ
jgi:RimJ/RimL family protein N-acetyltransferase